MKLELNLIFYLIFIVFVLFPEGSNAQIEQPRRYEVELKYSDDFFSVISAEENGIFLIRENHDLSHRSDVIWQTILLDTLLNEEWNKDIFMPYDYEIKGYDYLNDKIYLLFLPEQTSLKDHLVLEINLKTSVYQKYTIKRTINMQLTEFEILNNTAVFGGYVNNRPAVIQYYLKEGITKVLPGFYHDKSRLLQIDINDEKELITILSSIKTFNNYYSIAVKKFTEDGEMIEEFTINPQENTSLMDGRNISINNQVDIIAGTYSNKNSKYSRGIFLAYVDEAGEQNLLYYNYGDLENFFSYMKAKRQERVKNKITRKNINGKKVKFKYRLLVQDIIKQKDSYILVGEAYYPKYNNYGHSSYYGGYYSPNTMGSTTYFEGYKYTHAVVIGFGDKGKLLWDNSFEINDVMSLSLKQLVEVYPREEDIVLLYNYENVIRTKLIEGEEVIEGKSFNDISLKFQDDEAKSNASEYGGMELWYDEVFYAYGVQKIRNMKDTGVKLNREVFFINKIIYN